MIGRSVRSLVALAQQRLNLFKPPPIELPLLKEEHDDGDPHKASQELKKVFFEDDRKPDTHKQNKRGIDQKGKALKTTYMFQTCLSTGLDLRDHHGRGRHMLSGAESKHESSS